MKSKPKTAIFASHGGSTFQFMVEAVKSDNLNIDPILLITSNPEAFVLERAKSLNIESKVMSRKAYENFSAWDKALVDHLKELDIEFIILAGFMVKLGPELLKSYPNKIVNVHPSLLPKYGGKGMFGLNVHKAVLKNQERETGVTVHYVNEELDEGQIIAQKKVAVLPDDTPETLNQRLQEIEKPFYVEMINQVLNQNEN